MGMVREGESRRRRGRDVWMVRGRAPRRRGRSIETGARLRYTLTQIVDAALWTLNARTGGLEACPGRRMTFADHGPPGQRANLVLSKYVIPAIVFIQYAAQLAYPSKKHPRLRRALLASYFAAAVVMAYTSGCTDVVRARFPVGHDTLRWGGYSAPALPILLISAATVGNFCVVVDDARVLAVLVVPFLFVITFLWSTEGTLALGSKWCTYCLIYSVLFLAAPLWDGDGADEASRADARDGDPDDGDDARGSSPDKSDAHDGIPDDGDAHDGYRAPSF